MQEHLIRINTTYINDKKMNYKTLCILSYFSYTTESDNCRYIYYHGKNSLLENKYEIEYMSKNTFRTLKRNIEKMIKCNNEVITVYNKEDGNLCYKINPYAKDTNDNAKFIEMNCKVLECMCSKFDNNEIKVYCLLKMLSNNNEIRLSLKTISDYIGLSSKCRNNLKSITDAINHLCNFELVKRRKETIVENRQTKTVYYYSIPPIELFLNNIYKVYEYTPKSKQINISSNKSKPQESQESKSKTKNDPNMYYIVYEITDITNNMKYIGKHKTNDLNDGYMGSGRLLKQNQEIKGIDKFEKRILHLCKNEEHMSEMERLEIDKAKANKSNKYYNLI